MSIAQVYQNLAHLLSDVYSVQVFTTMNYTGMSILIHLSSLSVCACVCLGFSLEQTLKAKITEAYMV